MHLCKLSPAVAQFVVLIHTLYFLTFRRLNYNPIDHKFNNFENIPGFRDIISQ